MDTNVWIIISILLAAAVVILAVMLFAQRRRSGQLQQRFGPEYERTLSRSCRFRVKMRRSSAKTGAPCKTVLLTIRKPLSKTLTGRCAR